MKSGDTPIVVRANEGQARHMNLSRPKNGRVIAGVCAAVARRFGWNVTLVRVLTVLSILIPGPQVVLYIVLWILIPQEA